MSSKSPWFLRDFYWNTALLKELFGISSDLKRGELGLLGLSLLNLLESHWIYVFSTFKWSQDFKSRHTLAKTKANMFIPLCNPLFLQLQKQKRLKLHSFKPGKTYPHKPIQSKPMTSNNSPVHHPPRPNTAPAEACVQGRTCYVGNVPQLIAALIPSIWNHERSCHQLKVQKGNLNNYPICRRSSFRG